MALLLSVLIAVLVVGWPWGIAVVVAGAAVEAGEAVGMLWWSRRRRALVGAETLVGATAVALEPGWVRVQGERWRASSQERLEAGEAVRVEAVDGLTLVVSRGRRTADA